MNTLLEYKEYTNFKKYIKESLDEHMFDDDPGVDFDEHWEKVDKEDPAYKYITERIPRQKHKVKTYLKLKSQIKILFYSKLVRNYQMVI